MTTRYTAWATISVIAVGTALAGSACGGDSPTQAHPDASASDVATSGGGGGNASGSSGSGSGSASGSSSGAGGGGGGGRSRGSASGRGGAGGGRTGSGGTSGSGSGGDAGTDGGTSVLQFHKSPTRDGVYVDAAFGVSTGVKTLHLDSAFSVSVTGNVYAQPLYVQNGPSGGEMFVVATENNHLVAVDATGKALWDNTFGAPAPRSTLPCGNIDPLGITGTPVIDMTSTPPVIYFDTMVTGPKHMIHGVSLVDGRTEQPGFP